MLTSEMPAAIQLAVLCNATHRVSESAQASARRTLLDTLGVAAAGERTVSGKASARAAAEIWGLGNAVIWFSQRRLTSAGAAFVNATYASSLDLDDGHRMASGHPAAAIIPAVLSVPFEVGPSAERILTAIVIGYEVAVRISAARDVSHIRTTDTGLWCGSGVAAAVGWLTGQTTEVIAHAIAIAAQTATSQAATGWTKLGHTVKEGIPWASANGVAAVSLAAAGHRGPLDILDDPASYSVERLLSGFGQEWALERAYFKLYSCCRWAHAAIDGAVSLQQTQNLSHEEIENVHVETFQRALSLPNQPQPQSIEAAQYSIPFCVALALVHGPRALLPMHEFCLDDQAVVGLAKRVKLSISTSYAGAFPTTTPARVSIATSGASASLEVLFPKGDPQNPLTITELRNKFMTLSAPLGRTRALSVVQAASGLGINFAPVSLLAALAGST
jgi:2-methylcitrate dehydratase PrpD